MAPPSRGSEPRRLYNVAGLSFQCSAVIAREEITGPGRFGRPRGGAGCRQPRLNAASDGGADVPARDPPTPGGAGQVRGDTPRRAMPDGCLRPARPAPVRGHRQVKARDAGSNRQPGPKVRRQAWLAAASPSMRARRRTSRRATTRSPARSRRCARGSPPRATACCRSTPTSTKGTAGRASCAPRWSGCATRSPWAWWGASTSTPRIASRGATPTRSCSSRSFAASAPRWSSSTTRSAAPPRTTSCCRCRG